MARMMVTARLGAVRALASCRSREDGERVRRHAACQPELRAVQLRRPPGVGRLCRSRASERVSRGVVYPHRYPYDAPVVYVFGPAEALKRYLDDGGVMPVLRDFAEQWNAEMAAADLLDLIENWFRSIERALDSSGSQNRDSEAIEVTGRAPRKPACRQPARHRWTRSWGLGQRRGPGCVCVRTRHEVYRDLSGRVIDAGCAL